MDAGWGAGMGYPALILNPDDSTIDAQVFESDDLRGHWSRLDEFERPGYHESSPLSTRPKAISQRPSLRDLDRSAAAGQRICPKALHMSIPARISTLTATVPSRT